jgi:hypothetical protein
LCIVGTGNAVSHCRALTAAVVTLTPVCHKALGPAKRSPTFGEGLPSTESIM